MRKIIALLGLFGAFALVGLGVGVANAGDAPGADPTTHGVSQADANAACAAVVDTGPGDADAVAAFRAAYNTTDNTDDGPASAGLDADQQHLIYLQELHIDYLGIADLPPVKFTCSTTVAVNLVPVVEDTTETTTETTTATTTPKTSVPPTSVPLPSDGMNCDELTQAEAQRILMSDKTDPNNLDADKDGIACELPDTSVLPNTSSGFDTGDGSTE